MDKNKLSNLPTKPGVYLFKDENGQVLYVGKAINLKDRVSSYFKKSTNLAVTRPWANVMAGLAKEVETITVANEIEALMLESTLIKKYLPRFNIRLADDKSYPYIKYFSHELVPRFTVSRNQTSDGAKYYGPYLSTKTAYSTLEILRDVYGIHLSPKRLTNSQDRPCFNCQLQDQPCPLTGALDLENYSENCALAVEVLDGKRKRLLTDLKRRMETASNESKFELAAKLRDYLSRLTEATVPQSVISTHLDDYDTIGLARHGQLASVTHAKVRDGRLLHQSNFLLNIVGDETDKEIVEVFVTSYLPTDGELSDKLVVPCDLDTKIIEANILEAYEKRLKIITNPRDDKRQILGLSNKNAALNLEMKLLKRGDVYENLIDLQSILGLKELPNRIEAVDISNLGTSEAVGATVCFIAGKPVKDEYRRYKIKTVEGQNDFAMIREVVARRLSDTTRPTPDLLVIDGGIEQLKFAYEAVEASINKPTTLISLAKGPDRIFVTGSKTPRVARRGSKGLKLLSQIRDEVHRFAITFQRQRQTKRSLGTTTDKK